MIHAVPLLASTRDYSCVSNSYCTFICRSSRTADDDDDDDLVGFPRQIDRYSLALP